MGVRMAVQNRRIGSFGLTCAFTPAETGNDNLSSRMAEMFGDMARFVHDEASDDRFPLPELRYAVRRYAARCLHYFQRVGRNRLGWKHVLALYAVFLGGPLLSRRHSRYCLGFIADTFLRDRGVILAKR